LTWLTRAQLGAALPPDSLSSGLLLGTIPGEGFVPVSLAERTQLIERSAATLGAAGVSAADRVALSLGSDGNLAAALLAESLVGIGAAAAMLEARGRMRLLAAMRRLRPNVWVTTPTGALDFLARLYLEFNVDPMDLELEQILLVGEIASPGTESRLAAEFEARVAGLYCDPVFGVALAHRSDGPWKVEDPAVLGFADLEADVWQDAWDERAAEAETGENAARQTELVLRPLWSEVLADATIRTGEVVAISQDPNLFGQTVGEHLLIRGRWFSVPLLRRALAGIDGIAGWRLEVSRGDGTLDKLVVRLAFERASLVENPMWAGRAREAIASITPIAFDVETELAEPGTPAEAIDDARGHHLGLDRSAVAKRSDG
jgi:hypothetical protein